MESEERPAGRGEGIRKGGRFLLVLASFIIVIAGMRAARSFLVPILLSAFIAFLCWPPIRRLQAWKLPPWAAVTIVMLGLLAVLLGVSAIVGNSIAEFSANIGTYEKELDGILAKPISWLQKHRVNVSMEEVRKTIHPERVFVFVASTLAGILGALSDLLVILLITVFMLVEAEGLPTKLRMMDRDPDADITGYAAVTKAINDFLHVKTLISLFTGATIALFLAILGLDYPALWGLIAFLFNFIPNIGSFIAAIPAVLLALITKDASTALVVTIGYVTVNLLVGNVIEPRMMGKKLGLSVFVTVLSLIFWNWVLGPLGMLVSIPLTMIVKILLEHSDDLRPIAILLGPAEE